MKNNEDKKILFNNRGYGTVEFMLIFVASAVLATTVLVGLMPNLKALHEAMSNNIRDISGSGY